MINFHRHRHKVEGLDRKPGSWVPLINIDGTKSATITCPDCGMRATLEDHNIDHAGIVTPSLVCPHDGCTFHDWGKLEEW